MTLFRLIIDIKKIEFPIFLTYLQNDLEPERHTLVNPGTSHIPIPTTYLTDPGSNTNMPGRLVGSLTTNLGNIEQRTEIMSHDINTRL